MNTVAAMFGKSFSDHPLRLSFLKWQCRVRQHAMREAEGRPDDAIMPAVFLQGETEPLGHIITLINKTPEYSVTKELEHLRAKTKDPAHHRSQAIQFLSASYYQKAKEFSDILTATFPPGSEGAEQLVETRQVRLVFDAYAQRFELGCKVWRLAPNNLLARATVAHNILFNPALHPESTVLGFEPDWQRSSAEPAIG